MPTSIVIDGFKETKDIMRELGIVIDEGLQIALGERMSFALVCAKFGNSGVGNYVSNSKREDIILMLRDMANQLESGKDYTGRTGEKEDA